MKAGVKKSLRPKARPGKEKMKDMVEAAEQRKRDGEALKRSVKYRAKGGEMKKVKKMDKGGPTDKGTFYRRLYQANDDIDGVTKKFAERGTSGAAEAKKQKKAIEKKAFADLDNVDRYGKDAPKGRSFGQKTQPKKVKKMASGGNVCRGMGAAKRGGNFVVG